MKFDNLALHVSAKFSLKNTYLQPSGTPSVSLRCRRYQGTPTEEIADLQPLSHLTATAPLTQGSLYEVRTTLFSGTDQSLPCARGGGPR